MILTVAELKQLITTDKPEFALQVMLEGLEELIIKYTNNNFRNRVTGEPEYPSSIKTAVAEIVAWKLRNEAINSDKTEHKPVQSETISRHSVTYASDNTESDIDERFGAPKKYTAVFNQYMRARF